MSAQTIRTPGGMTSETQWVECVACGVVAEGSAEGWRAYLGGGCEGLPLEVAAFCPVCVAREFGD